MATSGLTEDPETIRAGLDSVPGQPFMSDRSSQEIQSILADCLGVETLEADRSLVIDMAYFQDIPKKKFRSMFGYIKK